MPVNDAHAKITNYLNTFSKAYLSKAIIIFNDLKAV